MFNLPLALICEHLYHPECASALAGTLLAIRDANNKDGSVIPEFASLSSNVTLKLASALDPYDSSTLDTMLGWWRSGGEPPAAIVGSYYSTQTRKYSQVANSYKVPQLAWVTAPVWEENPDYPGVLRLPPVDSRSAFAAYRLLEKMGVETIAIILDAGDTWSTEMRDTISNACHEESHKCSTTSFDGGVSSTDDFWMRTLSTIRADGIRTVVNLYAFPVFDTIYSAGAKLGMVGDVPSAAGYLWISCNYVFSFPRDKEYLWKGTLTVLFSNSLVKMDKMQTFREHWRKQVPQLKQFLAYSPLQSTNARDPTAHLWFAAMSYESVARVRMAAENVNFASLSSSPENGKMRAPNWYGSAILASLQRGTTMDGLIQGPRTRRSESIGLPWIENTAPHFVYSYVDVDNSYTEIYSLDGSGNLVESDGISRAILPGNIDFLSSDGVGARIETPCNKQTARPCRSRTSFGACQSEPIHKGARAGWCQCFTGKVGKYCNYDGPASADPTLATGQKEVDVALSIRAVGFDDFSSTGKAFSLPMEVEYTWDDPRFPWEDSMDQTGTEFYSSALTRLLLDGIWTPDIHISGRSEVTDESLRVKRNGANVSLTLNRKLQVTQDFVPSFVDFPFDKQALQIEVSTKKAVIRMTHDGSSPIDPEAQHRWNAQWAWDEGTYGDKWIEVTGRTNDYTFNIRVARHYKILIFRLIVPVTILAMTSWAAFWIPPSSLMPRFASGFIAFLALQPFKTFAMNLMPNEGNLNDMSWIDIYISVVGLFMGCAVLETVTSQYIAAVRSMRVSRHIDVFARWAFPFAFIVFVILMSVGMDTSVTNTVVHIWFALFVISLAGHVCREYHFAMVLLVQRHVRPITSISQVSERYRPVPVSENELHSVFDSCHAFHKDAHVVARVTVEKFLEWLEYACPRLKTHPAGVKALIISTFGSPDFDFPTFKTKFTGFLVELTLFVNSEDKEVAKIKELQKNLNQPELEVMDLEDEDDLHEDAPGACLTESQLKDKDDLKVAEQVHDYESGLAEKTLKGKRDIKVAEQVISVDI